MITKFTFFFNKQFQSYRLRTRRVCNFWLGYSACTCYTNGVYMLRNRRAPWYLIMSPLFLPHSTPAAESELLESVTKKPGSSRKRRKKTGLSLNRTKKGRAPNRKNGACSPTGGWHFNDFTGFSINLYRWIYFKKSLILMMIYYKQICKCILFFINPASSVNALGHTNIFAYT